MPGRFGSANPPVIKTLRFFFEANIILASSEMLGAIITSVNISDIFVAVSLSSPLLSAIIPPKAETESQFRAFE